MKTITHKTTRTAMMLACIGAATSVSMGGIVLDTFDADPGSAALGIRSFGNTIINDPFNQGGSFDIDTSFGAMFFNSGIGVEQQAWISYNNEGQGLDMDATAMGITHFELDFLLADQDSIVNIVLSTYDDNGMVVGDASWAALATAGADQTVVWSLGDLANINGDFDVTNIDDISINFNISREPTASLDFVATEFRAVPAPGALALFGLGSIISLRRKR